MAQMFQPPTQEYPRYRGQCPEGERDNAANRTSTAIKALRTDMPTTRQRGRAATQDQQSGRSSTTSTRR
ncbi:hypothetical protein ACPA9J_08270 [Pseudomonas aeruginosa]